MEVKSEITIKLDDLSPGLELVILSRQEKTLFDAEETAHLNNEARFQLVEGCYYDYELSDENYVLGNIKDNIVQPHSRKNNLGTIAPNIYVGTLQIPVTNKSNPELCQNVFLEVQSVKSDYRNDYRDMLELITEKCTDLLFQSNSPVSHYFEVDYSKDHKSTYQKFAFVKSVISSDEFKDSINKIIASPVTNWSEEIEEKDIRSVRRFTNSNVKNILRGSNRTKIPQMHPLSSAGISSVPSKISSSRKIDSSDTPENRFVKHALETFLKFGSEINFIADEGSKLYNESKNLVHELESYLNHSLWKEISRPNTLKLNSPILQRKEGYRELLRSWLMFELAAKLTWEGGEDVYGADKKDIATLYEYWLFFKLLELFQEIFSIDPKDISELIEPTKDGLNIKLKQGKFTALKGVFASSGRKLNIRFNYNRSFSGGRSYPEFGSWTNTLRPDYTLSFWPDGITEMKAEKEELIVHIHFDAKYKLANLKDFIEQSSSKDLDDEKIENKKGIYKNADLLKMHAYKDAIRRTGGAYVLYPGDVELKRKGFHEIIPGLGAFPVRPSKNNSGINHLKSFVLEVIDHFVNKSTQREKIAYHTYQNYLTPPDNNDIVNEPLPELIGINRGLFPDESYVLIGYCKSEEHLDWIRRTGIYNFRMDSDRGALKLNNESLNSRYLLIHMAGDQTSSKLFKISKPEFRVTPKTTLLRLGYPRPSRSNYLTLNIAPCEDQELINVYWNFKSLSKYKKGRASTLPFTVTLKEFSRCRLDP